MAASVGWTLVRDVPDERVLRPARLDALLSLVLIAFPVVGAVVASRQPRNAIGWILIGVGFAFVGTFLPQIYAAYGLFIDPGALPAADVVGWIAGFSWAPIWPLVVHLLLVFPSGRPLSARWGALVPVIWIGAALVAVGYALGSEIAPSRPRGPIGSAYPTGAAAIVAFAGLYTIVGSLVASAASLVLRFRRSRGDERQQVKWIAYAGSLGAAGAATAGAVTAVAGQAASASLWVMTPMMVGVGALPFAVAIAVLRYRLYDIDVLIERTVVYGSVSLALLGSYVGGVLVLQSLLRPFTAGSDLAVAGSTLLVVALFHPIRGRVQDAVDSRFYRSRYDASRTLNAFTARLRDEVDLDAIRSDVVGVIHDTVHPVHASVWLRERV